MNKISFLKNIRSINSESRIIFGIHLFKKYLNAYCVRSTLPGIDCKMMDSAGKSLPSSSPSS